MTHEASQLRVRVEAIPVTGGWRTLLRPAGPAGEITVRLPFGLTVWLDRAEPQLTLEVAFSGPTGASESLALLAVLHGSDAAELAEAERSGEVLYAPSQDGQARRLQALLAALGTLEERPAITVIDVAEHALALATELARGGSTALPRLVDRIATTCALRGVEALRVLPARADLRLTPEEDAALEQAIGVVRDLVGVDTPLGPIVDQPTAAEPEPPAGTWLGGSGLADLSLALLRSGQFVPRRPRDRVRDDAESVDLSGHSLPVIVSNAFLARIRPDTFLLEADVAFAEMDDSGQLTSLAPPGPPEASPQVWARALRRDDDTVLYASQCLIEGSLLRASLHVKPSLEHRDDFWIDLACDADAPVRRLEERRAQLAEREGVRAANRQWTAKESQQWSQVGELWAQCALLWAAAGDRDRYALASIHAARAYLAAGLADSDAAVTAAREARILRPRLDTRWLAPDLAQRASADPLGIHEMIKLSRLGPPVTNWVAIELERAISGPVPPLHDSYLRVLLELKPRAADPRDARIRRLRARARVALAYHASKQPATLPLASMLMAPASADWPYLDSQGRERFSAVNSVLLSPDLDLPSP